MLHADLMDQELRNTANKKQKYYAIVLVFKKKKSLFKGLKEKLFLFSYIKFCVPVTGIPLSISPRDWYLARKSPTCSGQQLVLHLEDCRLQISVQTPGQEVCSQEHRGLAIQCSGTDTQLFHWHPSLSGAVDSVSQETIWGGGKKVKNLVTQLYFRQRNRLCIHFSVV